MSLNIMGQYRPEYEVGTIAGAGRRDAGSVRYVEINHRPQEPELRDAYEAAREAGLWRFDERSPIGPG